MVAIGPRALQRNIAVDFDRPSRSPKGGGRECPPYMYICRLFSAQQVPCFSVGGVLGERVVGREIDGQSRFFNRNDVPDIEWNHIDGEKIYVVGGVGIFSAPVDGADVLLASPVAGGFDLHAQEATAGLDHEVVAAAVSPRLDYAQAVLGGAGHEKQFCPLAAQLEAAVGRFAVSEH
jgi:hypothetical protein